MLMGAGKGKTRNRAYGQKSKKGINAAINMVQETSNLPSKSMKLAIFLLCHIYKPGLCWSLGKSLRIWKTAKKVTRRWAFQLGVTILITIVYENPLGVPSPTEADLHVRSNNTFFVGRNKEYGKMQIKWH